MTRTHSLARIPSHLALIGARSWSPTLVGQELSARVSATS